MIRDMLAEFSTSLTYESLPVSVVAEVKRLLLDHVASMLGGPSAFSAEMPDLPKLIRARGGAPESTVIGVAGKYPVNGAVLSNTAMGFTGCDAWHKTSTMHVPAVLFSAAIAVAESSRASGRELIEAIVAGAEVMIRVSEALGPRNIYARGFHPTSVCGPIGCAVATGRLLNLDQAQMAEAISAAAVHAAGSSVWRGSRTPATFCVQIGRAAEAGVLSAQLAAEGCLGIADVFENSRGFPVAYAGHIDAAKLSEGLGVDYRIRRLMMHRFWFGPYLLTSIESLLKFSAENEIRPSDIASIEARVPHAVIPLIGATEYPMNRLATLTTLRYALSVVAHLGEKALYTSDVSCPDNMNDASIKSLFERVTVEGEEELDRRFPGVEGSAVTVHMHDGRVFSQRYDGPVRGDPDNPMSDKEIVAKFDEMATPILTTGCRDRIIAGIKEVDRLDGICALTALWAEHPPD